MWFCHNIWFVTEFAVILLFFLFRLLLYGNVDVVFTLWIQSIASYLERDLHKHYFFFKHNSLIQHNQIRTFRWTDNNFFCVLTPFLFEQFWQPFLVHGIERAIFRFCFYLSRLHKSRQIHITTTLELVWRIK